MFKVKKEKNTNLVYAKKKKVKNKKNRTFDNQNNKEFDADNEIIIGITKIPEKTKKKVKQKKRTRPKRTRIKKKKRGVSKKGGRIITILILIMIILATLTIALYSPIFNISEIRVKGNNKVSAEQIISLSQIKLNKSIFKINKRQITHNIKANSYIENLQIKRILPNIIELDIKERVATFMLKYEDNYAYINNQGFILEISTEKIDKIAIEGFKTKKKDIKTGERISDEDLESLGQVLKIVEVCSSNDILNIVSGIDISDRNNYIIDFETENKKAYLDYTSNLTTKILYIKGILQREKEYKGEIFVNMDLNQSNPYFRESV
ncbi:MAG: FtsQ-type POTRA domain-containing protein [Clostridia bacterium]|nr:FtsQ-type POTRA domain-containing protein [Clostridia bacterium]